MIQDIDLCSRSSILSVIAPPLCSLEGIIALGTQDLGNLVVLLTELADTSLVNMLVELPEQVFAQLEGADRVGDEKRRQIPFVLIIERAR